MIKNDNLRKTQNPFEKNKKPFQKRTILRRSKFPARNKVNDASFTHQITATPKQHQIKELAGDDVRFIALGGFEEVGRNMLAVETKDDLYIFDAGFQFTSEDDSPGIDYILPNTQYLEERKHKIKALIITHGHLDHIGGIPFLIEKLGTPPLYTRELTSLLIQKKMEEFPSVQKPEIILCVPGDIKKIGLLNLEFFNVTHSIPDSMGISIETPKGNIIITGDLKLRHENGIPVEYEEKTWSALGKNNNILMIGDSTNCENTGWSLPEKVIHENVENYIKNAPSRVIIGSFASQFERMVAFVKAAEKLNKKVVMEGRSVKINMEVAKLAGYFTPKSDTIIDVKDIDQYPSNRIVAIVTGSQGEEFAALPRVARGEHKFIKLNSRDTVILSSSIVPGNENSVRNLMDQIMRYTMNVLHYKTSDVHSTGHGNAEELAWIINKIKPKYFVPGYGFHSMLKTHKQIAIEKAGIEEKNVIVPDNGTIVELRGSGENLNYQVLEKKASCSPVMVDGYSIANVQPAVINDRKLLAKDGFINVIVLINVRQRKIQKSPDILSRGFVYLRESKKLLDEIRSTATRLTEEEILRSVGGRIEIDNLRLELYKRLSGLVLRYTNKQPIVMPVVLVV